VHKNYTQKILAVDPSLRSTGWALFDFKTKNPLAIGTIKSEDASIPFSERLRVLQKEIEILYADLKLEANDILVCEGPAPLVLNPHTALKVEHVRGIFETIARGKGIHVPGRINPRTWQSELLGLRGPQLPRKEVKELSLMTAKRLFPEIFAVKKEGQKEIRGIQDIADALLIGCLAKSKLEMSQKTGTDLLAVFVKGGRGRKAGSVSANALQIGVRRGGSRYSGWSEESLKKLQKQ
jgi:hypothetical protein